MAIDRAENAERSKGTEISSMLSKYNREMADLEEALRVRISLFLHPRWFHLLIFFSFLE
jgi:hypothetical protein